MDSQKLKSAIESLLFVSGEPMKLAKIAKICGVSKNEIIDEIERLNGEYQKEERGFSIIRKEDLVQLATNPLNSEFVNQLVSSELGSELSRSALEVLSIVGYRGPITRGQIETIRGVNCSYVLRSLMIKGLVERKETADIRGYLYEISFDFLKTLGVTCVQELPDWKNLSKNEKIQEILADSEPETAAEISSGGEKLPETVS
ncbi:MAG TPA: SMC-Scp complex subunit ScpB [Candidatus Bathyarchaeia archaeon]|nr:SMC-Scp complex subunit ScpB [Candidatus Bathyarchaeia archaeon]